MSNRAKRPAGSAWLRKRKGKTRKTYMTKAEIQQAAAQEQLRVVRDQHFANLKQAKLDAMSAEKRIVHEQRIADREAKALEQRFKASVVTAEHQATANNSTLVNTAVDADHWSKRAT